MSSKDEHSPELDALVDDVFDQRFNTLRVTEVWRVPQVLMVVPDGRGGVVLTLKRGDEYDDDVVLELDAVKLRWITRRFQEILED